MGRSVSTLRALARQCGAGTSRARKGVRELAVPTIDVRPELHLARLETDQTVHVISGYRSPKTNAALHERSDGVATHSLHMDGMAMDIRIPGVELAHLRDAALSLQRGGVGFYPGSDFVHVDVGRVRRW